MPGEIQFKDDHDILVVVVTKLDSLKDDVKEIKDGTQKKIDDHDKRIESLEKGRDKNWTYIKFGLWLGGIIFAMLVVLLTMMIYHLTGYKI